MTTTFDTSGSVGIVTAAPQGGSYCQSVRWGTLSPFTQGYVEAILRHQPETISGIVRFSDLAPETLARIIADCEGRLQQSRDMGAAMPTVEAGRSFWTRRQAGKRADMGFPPLTVQLADDGKVRFA